MTRTPWHDRLGALRAQLAAHGLDGFLVPLTDEHLSEYVGTYARRLEWLTGFAGSAGTAIVLAGRAALFTDGRYTLQVRQQAPADLYDFIEAPPARVEDWLAEHVPPGAAIGYDPWVHTRDFVRLLAARLAPHGARLVPTSANPVDAIWADRPQPSAACAMVHDLAHAGRSLADKRADIAAALEAAGADAAFLSALDSVAWAFNIRGRDVPRTPVVRAFALVPARGPATLFTDPAKITPEVARHLGDSVRVAPYEAVGAALQAFEGRLLVDPARTVAAVLDHLARGPATLVEGRDPVVGLKAVKNPVEMEGIRAAHARDGLAVTRFLHSLEAEPPADELEAEARLETLRRQSPLLFDLSFDTISGFGPNGAIVHYRATPATCRRFEGDSLYLVDSGGQYPDGTTDITRTVAWGTPVAAMRTAFTLVLKGHIALATARFPAGTRGGQLDVLARRHLWAAGLDYAHGTGHGVGHFLAVHEGPQRIAASAAAAGIDEPLKAGMLLSNEPGCYREGQWGIRIENLVLVINDPRPGDELPMLAFETVTLAPIDLRLVDPALLTPAEIAWLDAYHARVRDTHAPHLEGAGHAWLVHATRPLGAARAP